MVTSIWPKISEYGTGHRYFRICMHTITIELHIIENRTLHLIY